MMQAGWTCPNCPTNERGARDINTEREDVSLYASFVFLNALFPIRRNALTQSKLPSKPFQDGENNSEPEIQHNPLVMNI